MRLHGEIEEAEVREAVCEWLKQLYDLTIKPDQLRPTYPDYESFGGYEWDHLTTEKNNGAPNS